MTIDGFSTCFHTNKIEECKDFYTKYFEMTITFDSEWYVNMEFSRMNTLQFMTPQEGEPLFDEKGITLNIGVKNVDKEYQRLIVKEKLLPVRDIKDNPWGDRSFTIKDPIGNILYIYSDREPSEEYKAAYK